MNNPKRFSIINRIQWTIQRVISRFIGLLCECEWRWVKAPLIRLFKRFYRIKTEDCVKEQLKDYKSLNEFFIRPLKPGARTLKEQPGTILAPADSCISQMGPIQGETLLQAKGKTYTLSDLLAGDEKAIDYFKDGYFFTFYLAPSDYHRVHMPVTGNVLSLTYVPGFLFSVGHYNTQHVSQLFTRNERVISLFDTELGPLGMVQVGSCLVGHMGTVWESEEATPHRSNEIHRTTYPDQQHRLTQASEMGYFKLGSTVILLVGKDKVKWKDDLYVGKRVYCGETLGENAP